MKSTKLRIAANPCNSKYPYSVVGPKSLHPEGKRMRIACRTLADAKEILAAKVAELTNQKLALSECSLALQLDAVRAIELIGRRHPDSTLLDAARCFVEATDAAERSITVAGLIDAAREKHVSFGRKPSDGHLAHSEHLYGSVIRSFGSATTVSSMDKRQIFSFLDGFKHFAPTTRNFQRSLLHRLFQVAVDNDYIPKNPVAAYPVCDPGSPEIKVFTPAEAQKLLWGAWERDPALVCPLTLQVFAGIRVAESLRMEWRQINFDDGEMQVEARDAKNRHRRVFAASKNALAFLLPFQRLEGRVVPMTLPAYRKRRTRLLKTLGFKWLLNGPRRSCASYLCRLEGTAATAAQLGHSEDILKEHYRDFVPQQAALQFFNIFPPSSSPGFPIPTENWDYES
jgi:integrase